MGHTAVQSQVERVAQTLIRRWCGSQLRRHALLHVEGLEYIPTSGPALLVCRHVHHLYDGCVLLTAWSRPVHLMITLDWVPFAALRRFMAHACRFVRWPVVSRAAYRPLTVPARRDRPVTRMSVRPAVISGVEVLRSGEILAVFPEGYPNVDPVYTPKLSLVDALPFQAGFVTVHDLAQRTCEEPIPVIPVGFSYERGDRWRISMRCGPALYRQSAESRTSFVTSVQSKVMALSRPLSS